MIVAVNVAPVQDAVVGVTVYVAVPLLVPFTFARASAILVPHGPAQSAAPLTFDCTTVQVKEVPATVLFKLTAVVPLPQSVWVEGEADPTGVELTVSEEALVPVPPGPVTATVPDVDAFATVHVIVVELTTVTLVAAVPLMLTPVAPVKPVPVTVN